MLLALALAGCQEPFGTDRHDLVGDRVAAISVSVEGDTVTPRIALFQQGRPYSDSLPRLGWSWVPAGDDEAALAVEFGLAGEGPRPVLTRDSDRRLVLVVDWPSGEARHVLDVSDEPGTAPGPLALLRVQGIRVEDLVEQPADRDTRLGWATESTEWLWEGEVARLQATGTSPVRWMATDGDFLELSADTTDWFPGSVTVDDDEFEEVTGGEAGWTTVLALSVTGNNGFSAMDVRVGDGATWLRTPSGRALPVDAAVAPGLVRGVLRIDDDSPVGLRLEVLGPASPSDDPGTAQLCSVPQLGPFDPDWLLDGTCLRDEVDGATVVVEAR